MRTPVGQAIIFFGLLSVATLALGFHAFHLGDTVWGVAGIIGAVGSAMIVLKGVRMLRSGPPPEE